MISNKISAQLQDYLDYKHSLGFKLQYEETVLQSFVNYTLEQGYTGSLTRDITLDWIASGSQKPKMMGRKYETIRPFSKYVSVFDSEAEAVTGKIFRNVHDRPQPYIYSEAEVMTLMNECDRLFSPDGIRSRSIKCVIGLLWTTGMRPHEPLNLKIKDIDHKNQCIIVRETKFAKERIIPVSSSVFQEIQKYKNRIESIIGTMDTDSYLFRSTKGVPLSENALAYAFKLIRDSIQANPKGYPHVRLYDFRHSLACNTIMHWLKDGKDATALLYTLSSFLGHVKIEDTYWYLSATPELMRLTGAMYERKFGSECNE